MAFGGNSKKRKKKAVLSVYTMTKTVDSYSKTEEIILKSVMGLGLTVFFSTLIYLLGTTLKG